MTVKFEDTSAPPVTSPLNKLKFGQPFTYMGYAGAVYWIVGPGTSQSVEVANLQDDGQLKFSMVCGNDTVQPIEISKVAYSRPTS